MCASGEEYDAVLSFWDPLKADPKSYGEIVLQRLFETKPDSQKLFPKFTALSKEQLQNNPDLQAHGGIVVCKLTEFMQGGGRDKKTLKDLAESHAKQHKIPRIYFQIISDVIFEVVVEKIEGFGTDAQTALKNVLKTFQTQMGEFYDELGFDDK
ncbi:myoglobin isoform X2 [Erpetoichthys calabaricus]|uniref:Myoglobin n=1 Tax=Erpetoichthys calabaricus TaxID=27687 RepID=A0A8C4T9L5_ERPCA|nr:myoglobin isoform X2 [Erpetoichthys calabaricus]URH10252.1 myoglobin [Erpetoichthys calabaricus]